MPPRAPTDRAWSALWAGARLITEAEDAGVGLPTLIKVLEEQIDAMEEAIAE